MCEHVTAALKVKNRRNPSREDSKKVSGPVKNFVVELATYRRPKIISCKDINSWYNFFNFLTFNLVILHFWNTTIAFYSDRDETKAWESRLINLINRTPLHPKWPGSSKWVCEFPASWNFPYDEWKIKLIHFSRNCWIRIQYSLKILIFTWPPYTISW